MEIKRRNYFIDKNFQTRFIIKFCVIVFISSLVIGWLVFFLSTNLTTVAIEDARVIVKKTSDFLLPILAETIVTVTVFSTLAVIVLTLFTSHKIAGPLYRIRTEIDALKGGNLNANFHTRRNDQLQDLALSLSEMGNGLKQKHMKLKEKASRLREKAQSSPDDKEGLKRLAAELEEDLAYFKT